MNIFLMNKKKVKTKKVELYIVECDYIIQDAKKYKTVSSRGGTVDGWGRKKLSI